VGFASEVGPEMAKVDKVSQDQSYRSQVQRHLEKDGSFLKDHRAQQDHIADPQHGLDPIAIGMAAGKKYSDETNGQKNVIYFENPLSVVVMGMIVAGMALHVKSKKDGNRNTVNQADGCADDSNQVRICLKTFNDHEKESLEVNREQDTSYLLLLQHHCKKEELYLPEKFVKQASIRFRKKWLICPEINNCHLISTDRIALFLFSAGPQQEARSKRFAPRANRAIARKLIGNSLRLGQASGVDFFHISAAKQQGATFGERLTHAYQQLFDLGYERVISIGNDCPELSQELLQRAIWLMQQDDAVIGPALDGGAYLIGLSRKEFDADAFQQLPWQRDQLGEALQLLLKDWGTSPTLLAPLRDVDGAEDLRILLSEQAGLLLLQQIAALLVSRAPSTGQQASPLFHPSLFTPQLSRRGPPSPSLRTA
jgi:hypothetical protein